MSNQNDGGLPPSKARMHKSLHMLGLSSLLHAATINGKVIPYILEKYPRIALTRVTLLIVQNSRSFKLGDPRGWRTRIELMSSYSDEYENKPYQMSEVLRAIHLFLRDPWTWNLAKTGFNEIEYALVRLALLGVTCKIDDLRICTNADQLAIGELAYGWLYGLRPRFEKISLYGTPTNYQYIEYLYHILGRSFNCQQDEQEHHASRVRFSEQISYRMIPSREENNEWSVTDHIKGKQKVPVVCANKAEVALRK